MSDTAHSSRRTAPSRVERCDTVVIGAGQAGLAVGQRLAARDADFVVLDGAARIGEGWRRRWDSLRLFTPAAYSGLPDMVFPAPPAHLPDKDEVADYLERYAERFDLPVRLDSHAHTLRWNGERYEVRTARATYEATTVVVATGPFQRPRVPAFAAALSPAIHQLHSSEYRSPFTLPDGPALVVGAGNSGAQIALELARFRRVTLAGRARGRIPRRLFGRDVYDTLWPLMQRLTLETRVGRALRRRAMHGDPLVGIPERAIVDASVERVGRVHGVREGMPVCDDVTRAPAVIVWCTGAAPSYEWIELPVLDADGHPRHHRGVATDAPGLYFVGLRFQHRMTSALLGGVGHDAEDIAGRIAGDARPIIVPRIGPRYDWRDASRRTGHR